MTVSNKVFVNEEVSVDSREFVNCQFTNCTFVYRGGELPKFSSCTIDGKTLWRLADGARRTIELLRVINHQTRGFGRGIVEEVMNYIKNPIGYIPLGTNSNGIRELLQQIEVALEARLFYLALYISLTLPDICGAIDSNSGLATGKAYKDWFKTYLGTKFLPKLSAEDCYYFRCSLLHQGTSYHPHSSHDRIIFIEPDANPGTIHLCGFNGALTIEVRLFCLDVVDGVRNWLDQVDGTDLFQTNYDKFFRRYPQGLPPYVVGVPVYG
jgi:hypothetical protein